MKTLSLSALLLLVGSINAVAADPAEGKALYQSTCQTCHGESGGGDGPGIDDAILKPRAFALAAYKFDTDADWSRGTDADLANVIRNGPQTYGGSYLMPPWPGLSDEQINNLVAFIRTLEQPAQKAP